MKKGWIWRERKVEFNGWIWERAVSCFDEKERGKKILQTKIRKDIEYNKIMYPPVRKHSKECKWWFSKCITIIQVFLVQKWVLESTLEDLKIKKRKLWVSRSH